jgi:hypothetical protein
MSTLIFIDIFVFISLNVFIVIVKDFIKSFHLSPDIEPESSSANI